MSASHNADSLDKQGEFSSNVPGSEPLTTSGHKPGVKVGNDALPEFSAKTFPAGTAPSQDTYQSNPESEVPGQAANPDTTTRTDPLDFGSIGATSGTVHNATEFGHPAREETSSGHKKDRTGVEGRVTIGNAGVDTGDGSVESKARATGADLEGRAGELKGQRGYSGATEGGLNTAGAEETLPVGAEQVAAGSK